MGGTGVHAGQFVEHVMGGAGAAGLDGLAVYHGDGGRRFPLGQAQTAAGAVGGVHPQQAVRILAPVVHRNGGQGLLRGGWTGALPAGPAHVRRLRQGL
jgi:hypothetical protein